MRAWICSISSGSSVSMRSGVTSLDIADAERLPAALAPVGHREQVGVELAEQERVGVFFPVQRFDDVALPRRVKLDVLLPVRRIVFAVEADRLDAHASVEHGFVDVIAAALARDQVTLVDQLLVGQHHGIARDAEMARQFARRRQRNFERQLVVENRADDHLAQLALVADLAVARQRNSWPHMMLSLRFCIESPGWSH